MLAENALNFMLFQFGYLGRENIFEYWNENRHEFLEFIKKYTPILLVNPDLLESFEAKVRWKSPIGSLMVEEVRRQIRHVKNEEIDLEQLSVLYGRDRYFLNEFTKCHPLKTEAKRTHDLRGMSILNTKFNGCDLSDADLSYSCLDGNQFIKTTFKNCYLDQTTLRHALLQDVCFDVHTRLKQVGFQKSRLNGVQ